MGTAQPKVSDVVGADPQHREIRVRIVADQVSRELTAVGEKNPALRPLDDVAVGQDVAVGGDEEP